ncbi:MULTISPECIES: YqzL family protein [Kyrpidia]|uniref:YqzL family protein n=1 Tax=Kyrpidia TaxID=1129704 RepID=UPI0012FFEEB3|nr:MULTISPECIES: YqzL family protein [Kyrpidia]MCL6577146.1 YqzL family protein [Kyrpidia sp.]HHY68108.1 YqzL family protein [Alicyclobacillus sp.]
MRELSWRWFTQTGSIDAYLLYSQYQSSENAPGEEGKDPPASGSEEAEAKV